MPAATPPPTYQAATIALYIRDVLAPLADAYRFVLSLRTLRDHAAAVLAQPGLAGSVAEHRAVPFPRIPASLTTHTMLSTRQFGRVRLGA